MFIPKYEESFGIQFWFISTIIQFYLLFIPMCKLKEKIGAIVSLIIPLFVSAFQRSDDLANAMEARGYDPSNKRTKYSYRSR